MNKQTMVTNPDENKQLERDYPEYELIELYALKDYSYIWFKPINIFLRNGETGLEDFFEKNKMGRGTVHFRNYQINDRLLEHIYENYIRTRSDIKPTIKQAIKNVKLRIQYIDSAFLYDAPRTTKEMIVFRGKSEHYYKPARSLDTVIDTGYISTTTDIKVALRFIKSYQEEEDELYKKYYGEITDDEDDEENTDDEEEEEEEEEYTDYEEGGGGEQPCCLYRMHIMEGIPYIDMSKLSRYNTTHTTESEILLPRDLKITIIQGDDQSRKLSKKHKVKIIDIRVERSREKQFHTEEEKNLQPYKGFFTESEDTESEDTEPVGGNRRIKRRTNKLKNTHKKRITKRRIPKRRITKRRTKKRTLKY